MTMSISRQLFWAHFWSIVGMLPYAVVLTLTLAIFASANLQPRPSIPMLDPIGMLALGLLCFLFMLAVAGPQVWWIWRMTVYNPALRSKTALALRTIALVLLLSPWWITQLGL